MPTAEARGWGKGFPQDRRADMVKVGADTGAAVWVHRRIAPIVAYLFTDTERKGYDIRPGQCWGYANRAIRGGRAPSNHSWGLAIDINAPANPMVNGRLVTDMPDWMPWLWKTYQFGWGGDYNKRKDAMHYEFLGTPQDADRLVAQLGAIAPPAPPAAQPAVTGEPVVRPNARGDAVRKLQTALRDCAKLEVAVDGDYGPRTLAAVKAFQRASGLVVDGVVGAKTWAALHKRCGH